MGWVSYLHRAATTYYLCCGQALEDSQGAGRIGLTRTVCKGTTFFLSHKICTRFFTTNFAQELQTALLYHKIQKKRKKTSLLIL